MKIIKPILYPIIAVFLVFLLILLIAYIITKTAGLSNNPKTYSSYESVYDKHPDFDNSELLLAIDKFLDVEIQTKKSSVKEKYGEPENNETDSVSMVYYTEFKSYTEQYNYKAEIEFVFDKSELLIRKYFRILWKYNLDLDIGGILEDASITNKIMSKYSNLSRCTSKESDTIPLVLSNNVYELELNSKKGDIVTDSYIDVKYLVAYKSTHQKNSSTSKSSSGKNESTNSSNSSNTRTCAFDGCNAPASWGDFCEYHRKKMDEYWDASRRANN